MKTSKAGGLHKFFNVSFHKSGISSTTKENNIYKIAMQNVNLQKSQIRISMSQILPVLVKNLLLVSFGMTAGYPTIIIPSLSKPESGESIYLNEEQISWTGSISLLCVSLASLISGIVSQTIGRKITMQICSMLITSSWITFMFCNDVSQVYTGLVIFGLAGGLLESPALTYVAEITEPRLRGSLLSSNVLSMTLGALVEFLLGSIFNWRIVAQYSVIPPVATFILLFFVPESPYLLIAKNKIEEAKRSLAWVRGWTTVEQVEVEFQEILVNNSVDCSKSSFKVADYIESQFIRPFVLLCYLFFLYNFTGAPTISVFAIKLFETLGVPINEYDATVILGLAQFLGCLTCVLVIPLTGRRRLAFVSIAVAAISVTIVGTYAHLTNTKYLYSTNDIIENVLLEYKWIPSVFILCAAFALNCGVRTLPWNLLAEVFPMKTRAIATGAFGTITYCLGFGANKSFLAIIASITLSGIFWIYGLIGLSGLIIIYFFLPETEGRSLQEINDHFAGRAKLGKNVQRKPKVLEDIRLDKYTSTFWENAK